MTVNIIEQAWQSFLDTVFPKVSNPTSIAMLKVSYYTGAIAMIATSRAASNRFNDPAEFGQFMTSVEDEVLGHIKILNSIQSVKADAENEAIQRDGRLAMTQATKGGGI